MKWGVWTAKILLVMRIKQQETSSSSLMLMLIAKSEVKKAIHQHNYTDLKKKLSHSQSKKLHTIINEDFSKGFKTISTVNLWKWKDVLQGAVPKFVY